MSIHIKRNFAGMRFIPASLRRGLSDPNTRYLIKEAVAGGTCGAVFVCGVGGVCEMLLRYGESLMLEDERKRAAEDALRETKKKDEQLARAKSIHPNIFHSNNLSLSDSEQWKIQAQFNDEMREFKEIMNARFDVLQRQMASILMMSKQTQQHRETQLFDEAETNPALGQQSASRSHNPGSSQRPFTQTSAQED